MKPLAIAGLLSMFVVAGCGENSDSATKQAPAASKPQPQLGGLFSVSGNEQWDTIAEAAQLNCQGSFSGSPFRAQWFDPISRTGILVTGFPLEDGSGGTRVDNFQLTSLAGSNQRNARLTEASLKISEVSRDGRSAVYEVTAKGTLAEGGSFQASGHCRA